MQKTSVAGGIVVNEVGEVALVKNGPSFWGFPKGHVDEGESELEAAKREITEETGLTAFTLVRDLGSYERYKGKPDGGDDLSELKLIRMFLFSAKKVPLQPQDSWNPEAAWVNITDAAARLTHPKDREFFSSVAAALR